MKMASWAGFGPRAVLWRPLRYSIEMFFLLLVLIFIVFFLQNTTCLSDLSHKLL